MKYVYIKWQDAFSVNISEIDEQHKKLVGMINELFDAMKEGRGKTILSGLLDAMVDYSKTHFIMEEEYMKRFKFEGYAAHRLEHGLFIERVEAFRKKYHAGAVMLSVDILQFLDGWLLNHIRIIDKQYSAVFNMNGVA